MGRMFESTDDRVLQIVDGLYGRGVNLYVEDGEIRYKSSLAGTVTNDDLVDLDENKVALIAFLLLRRQGGPMFWAGREGAGDEAG